MDVIERPGHIEREIYMPRFGFAITLCLHSILTPLCFLAFLGIMDYNGWRDPGKYNEDEPLLKAIFIMMMIVW